MSETPPEPIDPYGEPEPPLTQPYRQPHQQQPYGQAPYGQPPVGPVAPGYPPYATMSGPDHPQATTVLVLGILGLVLCQVLSPFAWAMGNRVVREIDASMGRQSGRGSANAGRICGIVGTVLLGLGLAFVLLFVVVALVGLGAATTSP